MVLAEANSIIIRRQSIRDNFKGGHSTFKKLIPNDTYCSDKEVDRIGFMSYDEMLLYAKFLYSYGLKFMNDLVLFNMVQGPLIQADWID